MNRRFACVVTLIVAFFCLVTTARAQAPKLVASQWRPCPSDEQRICFFVLLSGFRGDAKYECVVGYREEAYDQAKGFLVEFARREMARTDTPCLLRFEFEKKSILERLPQSNEFGCWGVELLENGRIFAREHCAPPNLSDWPEATSHMFGELSLGWGNAVQWDPSRYAADLSDLRQVDGIIAPAKVPLSPNETDPRPDSCWRDAWIVTNRAVKDEHGTPLLLDHVGANLLLDRGYVRSAGADCEYTRGLWKLERREEWRSIRWAGEIMPKESDFSRLRELEDAKSPLLMVIHDVGTGPFHALWRCAALKRMLGDVDVVAFSWPCVDNSIADRLAIHCKATMAKPTSTDVDNCRLASDTYRRDRAIADESGMALAEFMDKLQSTIAPKRSIFVIAEGCGARVLRKAMTLPKGHEAPKLAGIVLITPDLACEEYKQMEAGIRSRFTRMAYYHSTESLAGWRMTHLGRHPHIGELRPEDVFEDREFVRCIDITGAEQAYQPGGYLYPDNHRVVIEDLRSFLFEDTVSPFFERTSSLTFAYRFKDQTQE